VIFGYFVLAINIGFVGVVIKPAFDIVLRLLQKHWKYSMTSKSSFQYKLIVTDYLNEAKTDKTERELISSGKKYLKFSFKIYLIGTILMWIFILFSILIDYTPATELATFITGLVAWLSPITIITERLILTDRVQVPLSIVLLSTAYYSAVFLENTLQYVQWQIEAKALESDRICAAIDYLYKRL
jgi:hypothetical protein